MLKFILIFIVVMLVVAIGGGIMAAKRSMAATKKIQASPKFTAIAEHIFKDGARPGRIVITKGNEIFYGPVNGNFLQVPGDLIPSMGQTERHGLAGAFEQKYAYSSHLCNSGLKSGFGAAPADTGIEYIDLHADMLLISKVNSVKDW